MVMFPFSKKPLLSIAFMIIAHASFFSYNKMGQTYIFPFYTKNVSRETFFYHKTLKNILILRPL